jgi:hypothetical protein
MTIQVAGFAFSPEEWHALDEDERSGLLDHRPPVAMNLEFLEFLECPYEAYEVVLEPIPGL